MTPKPATENLPAPTPGREIIPESNWALRALLRAFETSSRPEQRPQLRELQRGVQLYPRDREAVKRGAREAGLPPAEYLAHVLWMARWAATRALCFVDLDMDLTEPLFKKAEDRLTADFTRYLLGSDRTEARRAARQELLSPTQPANADRLHEWADAHVLHEEEAAVVDAKVRRVFAAATKTQEAQLQHILDVWRKAPSLTFVEACTAAGVSRDQRKNLSKRLRKRLQ